MGFADQLPDALGRGAAAARRLMRDTFEVYAPTTQTVDRYKQTTWQLQHTTVGKVAGTSREGDTDTRTVQVGDVERPVITGGLHVPLDAPLPQIGWEYQCTAIGAGTDPALLGRRWRVVDVPAKSHATARRLDVVEVTR